MDPISILVIDLSLLPFLVIQLTKKFIFFTTFSLFAIFLHGIYLFGPQIIYFLLIIYLISTVIELISLKTSLNFFGIKYSYSLNHPFFSSGIALMGVYPLEVSLSWVILKYISFTIALLISQAFSISHFWIIFLSPLILLSQDLIIDPVAVNKTKLWKWEKGSAYFGIPVQNFIGWYLVGFISSLIFSFIDTGRTVTFHPLYILPVIFYAMIIRNMALIFRIDKVKAFFGSLPAVIWTILGIGSLIILYLKQG